MFTTPTSSQLLGCVLDPKWMRSISEDDATVQNTPNRHLCPYGDTAGGASTKITRALVDKKHRPHEVRSQDNPPHSPWETGQ